MSRSSMRALSSLSLSLPNCCSCGCCSGCLGGCCCPSKVVVDHVLDHDEDVQIQCQAMLACDQAMIECI